jgi:polysaccharide pyruvyl transferase WcaK-like protein
MRILIDSGSYHALNVGDVAMLQACIVRLRELWPGASIAVVTNSPDALTTHCPDVRPVPLSGRVAFTSDSPFGRAARFLPRRLSEALEASHERIRQRWPAALAAIIAGKRLLALRGDCFAAPTYVRAVTRADLVVASGAGVFTDAFTENANGVLDTLDLAVRHNVPAVAFGQGIGPVSNQALLRRMAAILPRLDLIGLRERRESARVLNAIGVRRERIIVTGDDAMEMAALGRAVEIGGAIGVNVRVAPYAGVTASNVAAIRPAVRAAARRLAAPLVAVPIAHHSDCHDGVAIRAVLADDDDASSPIVDLATPARAIAEVSCCRVVVTGSYHAAVFALAQGIPVVAIAATEYYRAKFTGLAELFGGGCTIVANNSSTARQDLEGAIIDSWVQAQGTRRSLLDAADAQIRRGREAYRRLGTVISSHAGAASHLPADRPVSAAAEI